MAGLNIGSRAKDKALRINNKHIAILSKQRAVKLRWDSVNDSVQNSKVTFLQEIKSLVIRSVQTIPVDHGPAGNHLYIDGVVALNDVG